MTRETLQILPQNVRETIEYFRKEYKQFPELSRRNETRSRMGGYIQGLRDAGLITERQRQIIFCYMTV